MATLEASQRHFVRLHIINPHFYKDNSQFGLHNDCLLIYSYHTILWERKTRTATASKAGIEPGINVCRWQWGYPSGVAYIDAGGSERVKGLTTFRKICFNYKKGI